MTVNITAYSAHIEAAPAAASAASPMITADRTTPAACIARIRSTRAPAAAPNSSQGR